jgi:glucose-6-phosphate 1-dehydrogenase
MTRSKPGAETCNGHGRTTSADVPSIFDMSGDLARKMILPARDAMAGRGILKKHRMQTGVAGFDAPHPSTRSGRCGRSCRPVSER